MSDVDRHLGPKDYETIGRITVAATMVEDELYGLAEDLGLEDLRRLQARETADEVKKRVKEAGLPLWATVSPEEVLTAVSAAKGALAQRGDAIHSVYPLIFKESGLQLHVQPTNRKKPVKTFERAERTAVLEALRRSIRDLHEVHLAVLPEVLDHVHVHFFGSELRPVVVANGPDSWPPRPTAEELFEGIARFSERYGLQPPEPPSDESEPSAS